MDGEKKIRTQMKKRDSADLNDLQKRIGYTFKDIQFLRTAVTHASALPNRIQKNSDHHHYYYEQLEFLGDRVLGLAVAHLIYDTFPSESEGDWAKRHAEAVRESTLAGIAEKLDLGGDMVLSSGEQRSGGRKKKAILADVLEAVIAAIYLDGGYRKARKFIEAHWRDLILRAPRPPEDPKTKLQEWLQAQGMGLPEYRLVARSGPDHAPEFKVALAVSGMKEVCVTGESKRKAEKKAAQMMLEQIAASEKASSNPSGKEKKSNE